ncbi:MAG: carbohydrate ABC transporter permease [Verrucomicrobia bacterium]|nr:carbohydrate ABC transporter permease [Verrucomicrobiota bacterium]MCH8526281.1 carbohydrate ABC transporter permease [Kiritimatiellia bacterium]
MHSTRLLKPLSLCIAYALLLLAAAVTLVPFVWLVFASLRAPEVYFEFQFVPRIRSVQLVEANPRPDLAELWQTLQPARGLRLEEAREKLGAENVDRGLTEGMASLKSGAVDWTYLTGDYFKILLTQPEFSFVRNILNSVFYASVTAVFATLFAAMGGYALAKFDFRLRGAFTRLVLLALILPGALLLAPGYQLLFRLGLLDTYAGLILPGLAPAFGVFLFRQTMLNSVPMELMEAARMDGCGEIRLFFAVILPLVRPMIGAFLLIMFLGAWNNFIGPQIVLQTPSKFPLSVAIAQLKGVYSTDYGLLMAGTLISIAPIMALFLLLQKEFISGLTSGAVKG